MFLPRLSVPRVLVFATSPSLIPFRRTSDFSILVNSKSKRDVLIPTTKEVSLPDGWPPFIKFGRRSPDNFPVLTILSKYRWSQPSWSHAVYSYPDSVNEKLFNRLYSSSWQVSVSYQRSRIGMLNKRQYGPYTKSSRHQTPMSSRHQAILTSWHQTLLSSRRQTPMSSRHQALMSTRRLYPV